MFLEHDGVPWNNNNAEQAVKPFAKYRVIADGMLSEAGLEDYLVLLSIQQTCRRRGVNFLRFLLSRERDVRRTSTRSVSDCSRHRQPRRFRG